MGGYGWKSFTVITVGSFIITALLVSADEDVKTESSSSGAESFYDNALNFLWQKGRLGYTHVWPEMQFGWKIVVGSIIGFIGAAFGSVGGVGGGGFFVPMLSLIIGFDAKSAAAMSKFMIVGAAGSTVYYNIKLRHPTLDMPLIDYDLALLFQPMLVLGISIGVICNVIFAEWMITILLIILFVGASTKAFLKGVETWKMETIIKDNEAAKLLESHSGNGSEDVEYTVLPDSPAEETKRTKVPFRENVAWKELGMLVAVWFAILGLELGKNYSTRCSAAYWVLNLLQIPVAVGVSGYEAVSLYKGKRVISSTGTGRSSWKVHQLILYCLLGVLAGVAGGLLGLGGGFILGPLFLELGIPPQVASATATFAMTFSSSMSVVEFYLLKRFPVPYALYFVGVSTVAGIVGHYTLRRLITILGRASLIIFILASMIFISAISLGGVGIANIIIAIEDHAYMGFDNICTYTS